MNKQQEILDHLKNREIQYPPTVREIGNQIGVCVATAHHHLSTLKDRGLITWEPIMPRTIRLVRPA